MKRLLIIFFTLLLSTGCSAYLKQDEPNKKHYLQSHALFNEKKYAEAAEGFRSFVEKYPDDELADDAQYFFAYTLSYYDNKDKDYEKALAEFKRLIVKYPRSYWIKDAKHAIAQIEEILKLKDEANYLKLENEKLKLDIKKLMRTDIEIEKKRKKIK
ncbi:MAG: tetratricopeptide repeat protein [Nitrospirae bacterium]|nr:tetratricopeptide repeat protein [Nitrospirota bacterium]